ncbi:MAG: PDGLE domain-containing protein [Actinobacteria bacterium]|nr:PDGLE domain-containing protein [Actinomycetota bacterium]
MKAGVRGFLIVGLAVSVLLAFWISPLASSSPDGLERVAGDSGFSETAAEHGLSGSPLAEYSVRGVGSDSLSTGLSGIIGVLLTFAAGYGLFVLMRPKSPERK